MSNNLAAIAVQETGEQYSRYELARRERYAKSFAEAIDKLNFKMLAGNSLPAEYAGQTITLEEGATSTASGLKTYMKSIKSGEAKNCNTPLARAVDTVVKLVDNNPCGGAFVQSGIQTDFGNTAGKFINLTTSGSGWTTSTDCTDPGLGNKTMATTEINFDLIKCKWECSICSLEANGLGMGQDDVANWFARTYAKEELVLQDQLVLNQILGAANNGNIAAYNTLPSTNHPITESIAAMVSTVRAASGSPSVAMDAGLYHKLVNEMMTADIYNNNGCCITKLSNRTDNCTQNYMGQISYGPAAGVDLYVIPLLEGGNVSDDGAGNATGFNPGTVDNHVAMVYDPEAIVLMFGDRSHNKYNFFPDTIEAYRTGCIMAAGTVLANAVVCDPNKVTYWVTKV